MALGFIKKIFSFGKKEVEETPVDIPLIESDKTETVEQTYEDTAAQETLPVGEETSVIEVEESDAPVESAALVEDTLPEPKILSEPEPEIIPQADIESTEPLEQAIIETVAPVEIKVLQEEQIEPEPELQPEPEFAPETAPEIISEPEAVIETPVVVAPEDMPATPKPLVKKVTVSKTVQEKQDEEPQPVEPEKRISWFERLRKGLSRSSQQLGDSIGGIFTRRKLDEDTLQDLEDVLIQADLGMETAIRITGALSATRYGKDISTDEVRSIMATEIERVLGPVAKPLELDLSHKPHVILVVGVNGTGKTTTIGKLAAKLTAGGLNVMLAAGDTFRAAAIEQLHIWGKRTGAPVVSSKLGADAAGLAFDAWKQAKEAGSDVLIIDTAGRLQNRVELMEELAKIVRVLGKHDPEAPHTVLQTLDATTGQNALNQVEIFRNIAGVNGLVMTKLDGTARGGILVAISAKHKLPVYFIGVGEQVDDLEPFAASDFAKAIAGVA
ncbi:signal recognition particle-docking protein FtsY [Phyllobacterium sp. CCNWLW109]|uniref:signal recognition particle-docking protein FtsY n=1 Tax=Phyllobacterium sp. CCNWLW109 TaxID=3127479 RepID=UPI0030789E50